MSTLLLISRSFWTFLILIFSAAILHAQDVTLAGPAGCGSGSSSGTWTVPCDVTSLTVQVYGGGAGGGGGGGGSSGGVCDTYGGGAGGGGGYTTMTINVTPGSSFTYTVGAGGCGGSNGSDQDDGGNGGGGISSTFVGTNALGSAVNLVANGGSSGSGGDGCDVFGSGGGNGGGGSGGSASGGSTNTPGGTGGGGSGSSGGAGGAGAGPSGGNGGTANSGAGATYGGGGAGGGNSAGGIGAAGGILITYVTQGSFSPTVSTSAASCIAAGTATVSNYNANMTYSFTPAGPTVGAGGAISNLVAGISYTAVATIGSCVSPASSAFSVEEQLSAPTITVDGTLGHCPGETTTLTASGAQSYVWDDPSGTATAEVSVTQGTYMVIGTDAGGCTGTATVVVEEFSAASVDLGPDQDVCGVATITVDAGAGAISYEWSGGQTTQTADLASGTHWVEVSNGSCTASDTIVITANLNPTPSISPSGNQSICDGGTITLDAGSGYGTYLWEPNGEQTQTIIVSESGSYSAVVSDDTGCEGSSDTVNVTIENIDDVVIVADGPFNFCEGDSVTLDAGAGYDSYLWSNGATTQTITVLVGDDYSVTGTSGGCSFESDTVTVSVSTIEQVILASGTTLSVPSIYTSYQWFLNGSPIPGAIGPTYTATSNGNYTVQVTDANGCTSLSYTLEYTLPDGVNELEAILPFVIYPNPSQGYFQLDMDSNEPYTVTVLTTIGQKVSEVASTSSNRVGFSLETSGVYLVQVQVNGALYHKRIVVE